MKGGQPIGLRGETPTHKVSVWAGGKTSIWADRSSIVTVSTSTSGHPYVSTEI